jgi:hypothetical protein
LSSGFGEKSEVLITVFKQAKSRFPSKKYRKHSVLAGWQEDK